MIIAIKERSIKTALFVCTDMPDNYMVYLIYVKKILQNAQNGAIIDKKEQER